MKYIILLILLVNTTTIKAQIINGVVLSKKDKEPIIGAIFTNEKDSLLYYSDKYGNFSFNSKGSKTISITAFGFIEEKIDPSKDSLTNMTIFLTEKMLDTILLDEVELTHHKTPILKDFSVKEIKRFDVYNNPNTFGDMLRTVATLPSSTETEESAEISIRGTGSNQSILFFNNVPIYKSFRGTNTIAGLSTFSILNTQTVKSLNVFSGNPPLYLGHSSGGLIEAHTIESLERKNATLSIGISTIGGYYANKYAPNKASFFQIFANNSFSDIFKTINNKSFPYIKDFFTQDIGLNTRVFFSDKSYMNFYSFSNFDKASFEEHLLTYKGEALSQEYRSLNILNFTLVIKPKNYLQYNLMADMSKDLFTFGNIKNFTFKKDFFSSISWIYEQEKIGIQIGADSDYRVYHFEGTFNKIPFQYNITAPKEFFETNSKFNSLQGFLVLKYKPYSKFMLSYSGRIFKGFSQYKDWLLNQQLSLRYATNTQQSITFSIGNYSNYGVATYPYFIFPLYKSQQATLDFQQQFKNINLSISFYYNRLKANSNTTYQWEDTNIESKIEQHILGAELLTDILIAKHFKWKNSITIFSNKEENNTIKYHATRDVSPIIKTDIQYSIKALKTVCNIVFTYRNGKRYTPIINSYSQNGIKNPVFGSKNSFQLPNYSKIDFNIYRIFQLKKSNLVVYATLANILNTKNLNKEIYDERYIPSYQYYNGRMFYLGSTFSFL